MSAETANPKALVVGAQGLANKVAEYCPHWTVFPAAATVNDLWDNIESRQFPYDPAVVIFTDGSGTDDEELEASMVEFARYSKVLIVARPERGTKLAQEAARYAAREGATNITEADFPVMPMTSLEAAMSVLHAHTSELGAPPAVTEPPAPAPNPVPAPAPSPSPVVAPPVAPVAQEPVAPPVVPAPAPANSGLIIPPAPTLAVPPAPMAPTSDHAPAYAAAVVEHATRDYHKRPDAIPNQMTIAVMSSKGGSGKCARLSDTLIVNPITGVPTVGTEILDDKKAFPQTTTFDRKTTIGGDISNYFHSGTKEVFVVRTQSGRKIALTDNHPILTANGWLALKKLEVGETIAVAGRIPFAQKPVRLDAAELELLAGLMAEGGTSGSVTSFTNEDPTTVSIIANACQQHGLQLRPYTKNCHQAKHVVSANVHERWKNYASHYAGYAGQTPKTHVKLYKDTEFLSDDSIRDEAAFKWLQGFRVRHGLHNVLAKNKKMPEAIYRLPEDQLCRFLSIFWMCDGYVVAKGSSDVGVTLASQPLVVGIQHLLLRLGIQSSVQYKLSKAGGKEFDAWRLTVMSDSFQAFSDAIELWGKKRENMDILLERQAHGKGNPNLGCPTYSEGLYRRLVAMRETAGNPGAVAREALDSLGWNVETHVSPSMILTHKKSAKTGRKHLNLKGLRAWCEAIGPAAEREFGWIYDSDIFWDEIVSIESDGEHEVFDIEVPGTHNFVANDVIVHNSTTALSLAGMVAASSAAAGDPKRVVLVDLDTRDGQVGSLIGQYVPTAVNIRVLPVWDATAVKSQLVHDQKLGIDALLAPLRPRNADDVGPEFYSQIIQVLQTTHDVVILDCSVNYLDPLLGMGFALADELLFVTTLAATSVQGMARALTELFADPTEGGLGIPREKVGVVANMVINNVGMKRDTILKAALGAPLVGQIPAAQDDVLLATNHTRMADLLKNPRLGPAYFKLAQTCLPGWALAPIATGSVATPGAPGAPDGGEKKKGGLFRR